MANAFETFVFSWEGSGDSEHYYENLLAVLTATGVVFVHCVHINFERELFVCVEDNDVRQLLRDQRVMEVVAAEGVMYHKDWWGRGEHLRFTA